MTAKAAPPTLSAIAAAGDRRATLEALRAVLVRSIEVAVGDVARSEMFATPQDPGGEKHAAFALGQVATLSKQLRDTVREIAGLADPKAASAVDEIAKRRVARLTGAAVPAPTKGKVVGRKRSGRPGSKRGPDPGTAPAPRARRSAGRKT